VSHRHPILLLFLVLGCEKNPRDPDMKIAAVETTPSADSTIYDASWNMGEVPDEPDSSVESRFTVHVKKLSSGILTVYLDSAPSTSRPGNRRFFRADSVKITGLIPDDRFTRGCGYGVGPWRPTIGVLRDSVYERSGRPRFIWVLDTLRARIRELPTDSASCFIAGPD
jgi:hypothetical protein